MCRKRHHTPRPCQAGDFWPGSLLIPLYEASPSGHFFRCDIWPERKTDRGENYSRGLENDPDHSKMSFHSIHKAATLGRIFNVEMIFEFWYTHCHHHNHQHEQIKGWMRGFEGLPGDQKNHSALPQVVQRSLTLKYVGHEKCSILKSYHFRDTINTELLEAGENPFISMTSCPNLFPHCVSM